MNSAKNRLDAAARSYDKIVFDLEETRGRLDRALQHIGKDVVRSIKNLKRANQLIAPLKSELNVPKIDTPSQFQNLALKTLDRSSLTVSSYSEVLLGGGVGLGIGSAAAIGSWAAVSALGAASTGTAIASLHGAAATNAILASLGHGSLAAGGTGILGGKLALGGIVLLPVAAIMGFVAHTKADEINERASEIEAANDENSETLTQVNAQLPNFDTLIWRVGTAADELEEAVKKVNNSVLKFGVLSRIYKTIRLYVRGYYYDQDEMQHIDQLRTRIDEFLRTIGADRNAFKPEPPDRRSGILMLN